MKWVLPAVVLNWTPAKMVTIWIITGALLGDRYQLFYTFHSILVKEISAAIAKAPNMQMLRLEGNTVAPEAAEGHAKALKETKNLERFIGNDLFTGRLKDEIPLALVIWLFWVLLITVERVISLF